jgi:hypothetical protein
MRFQITFDLIERLRRESIGTPQWMPTTLTYEYAEHSARVVAILKLVRSAHGVAALEILRLNGLFIDLGMVTRGVFDSVEEVYFLLEQYPNTSRHVDQFVMAFFESDISGYLSAATNDVLKKHIRSARVRCLTGAHDQTTQDLLERIFRTFACYGSIWRCAGLQLERRSQRRRKIETRRTRGFASKFRHPRGAFCSAEIGSCGIGARHSVNR